MSCQNNLIEVGDRFYVNKVGKINVKLKCVATNIDGNIIIDEFGWFYRIEWCKPLIKVKGVLCGQVG